MYLFPYLIQKSNYLTIVTIPSRFNCYKNAYVFNSSGSCIYGNEKISKNHNEPIYNKQRMNESHQKGAPLYLFDLCINLAQFSVPGTTIFITGEYINTNSASTDINCLINMQFLFMGDNNNDIAFGIFPVLHYKLINQAIPVPKKIYPVILFSLSFINGEWIYTPINDKLENAKKETIEKYASNYFNKA